MAIVADNIVYNFHHSHTSLRSESITLATITLQTFEDVANYLLTGRLATTRPHFFSQTLISGATKSPGRARNQELLERTFRKSK